MTLINYCSDASDEDDGETQERTVTFALDNHRHMYVVKKLEGMVQAMQHPDSGVPFKAQKSFLSSVPAAVSGNDLISWVRRFTQAEEPTEANHIASLLAIHGYVYPLSDGYSLVVRDDQSSLYRFQSPYYWLSISGRPDNLDYAIYLTKRMIRSKQKAKFEDFEKLALSKLQKILADRWQFIALQAEEELRLSRERKKSDRLVLDMQEHAYWRVHRPPPGYMNPVDHPVTRQFSEGQIQSRLTKARRRRQQTRKTPALSLNASSLKSVETMVTSYELSKNFDWFLNIKPIATVSPAAAAAAAAAVANCNENQSNNSSNMAGASISEADHAQAFDGQNQQQQLNQSYQSPWVGDDLTAFQNVQGTGENGLTPKQIKTWGASFDFLLKDAAGREYFKLFLTKEFSSENLRFWLAVQNYKFGPLKQLKNRMSDIFEEFLAPGAPSEINIDSKTMTITQKGMQSPTRFTFEEAQEHIYLLMKKDSYQRFLRSEDYKSLLQSSIDRHSQKKRGVLFNFVKKTPAQATQSLQSNKSKLESQNTLDASSSSGMKTVKSSIAVRLPDASQPGPSNAVHFQKGSAEDVTPWEADNLGQKTENCITPWEDS